MSKFTYNRGLYEIQQQNLDFVNDTIKALILDDTHTPDINDDYLDEVTADEVSGTNYSRITLSNKSIVLDDGYNSTYFTTDDLVFGTVDVDQKMGYIVVYKDTGDATTSPLIHLHQPDGFPADGTGQDVGIDLPDVDSISNVLFYVESKEL